MTRLIDADLLKTWFDNHYDDEEVTVGFVSRLIDEQPTIEQPVTTWLGNYCPYTCQHCGKHTDSKTPFCAWCGRRASNYD